MVKPLDFQIELLFEFEHLSQRLRPIRRRGLSISLCGISSFEPGEILAPFVDVGEEMGQVPFVGLGNFVARPSVRSPAVIAFDLSPVF